MLLTFCIKTSPLQTDKWDFSYAYVKFQKTFFDFLKFFPANICFPTAHFLQKKKKSYHELVHQNLLFPHTTHTPEFALKKGNFQLKFEKFKSKKKVWQDEKLEIEIMNKWAIENCVGCNEIYFLSILFFLLICKYLCFLKRVSSTHYMSSIN